MKKWIKAIFPKIILLAQKIFCRKRISKGDKLYVVILNHDYINELGQILSYTRMTKYCWTYMEK